MTEREPSSPATLPARSSTNSFPSGSAASLINGSAAGLPWPSKTIVDVTAFLTFEPVEDVAVAHADLRHQQTSPCQATQDGPRKSAAFQLLAFKLPCDVILSFAELHIALPAPPRCTRLPRTLTFRDLRWHCVRLPALKFPHIICSHARSATPQATFLSAVYSAGAPITVSCLLRQSPAISYLLHTSIPQWIFPP